MKKRFVERLERLGSAEQGFTLLELLVTIVILSILMATASQYYFHQRRKAWAAQVHASVRHMAGAENNYVFGEGAPAFTRDLDDLYVVGYRWSDESVRPYVALATRETFCIQVHSAHDPSIVWHFSSAVGRPRPGPATPRDCGDPEVLGTYIAGLPPDSAGRDGRLSSFAAGTFTASTPGGSSTTDGGSSVDEGRLGSDATSSAGSSSGTETSSTGSMPGYGTSDTTSGTVGGGTNGGSASTDGCTGGDTGTGSTTGTNHPSGKDRDAESGGSGSQGSSTSDPDGDENDGADKPGEDGGANTDDQDGNNGSGNDTDFEDDNKGPDRDGSPNPGTNC